jgi:tetratricopeptide (TPR) repeat protein
MFDQTINSNYQQYNWFAKNLPFHIVLLCLLLQFLFSNSTAAQQNIEDNAVCFQVNSTINIGTHLFRDGKYELAIERLNEAISLSPQDSCPQLIIRAYIIQAQAFLFLYDYENSITNHLNAIAVAEKIKSDSLLVNLYQSIGETFFQIRAFEKAVEYYTKTINLQLAKENKALSLYLLENIGLSNLGYGNSDGALKAFQKLLSITEPKNDIDIRIRILFKISEIYKKNNDWGKAIEYCEKLYKEFLGKNDIVGATLSLNNMGSNQISKGDYLSAEQTLIKALNTAKGHPIPATVLAGIYTNLGICFQNQGNYIQSLNNLNNAAEFIKGEPYPAQLADVYNTMAWVYFRKGDLYNASQQSRSSIEKAIESKDPSLLATCYYTYSQLLREGNDHVTALDYYEKYSKLRDSLELEKRILNEKNEQLANQIEKTEREQRLYITDKEMQELILKQLRLESESQRQEIELLKKERELEQSEKDRVYQTLMLAKQEQEAALQKSTIRNLEQENAIKEFQIRQKEAEELQREKEIALLQSEKKRQELQIEKEAEARKRAVWMLILSSLVLIIVIASLVVTRKKNLMLAEQKKTIEVKNVNLEKANADITEKNLQLSELAEEVRAQNEEITVQKDLIEEKNKDITDSIQYASLIQNAVLPPIESLKDNFSDFFVLYKPRDIVSGDFWWCRNNNSRNILVVADCTGHGVPGAFLSMLGSTILTEIVNQYPNIRSNELLDQLQKKMIDALVHGKNTDPRRDGMDITVCIFNAKSKNVEISGANNPVYILRDGVIEIIKGDKTPIGLSEDSTKKFTQKNWITKPKDRFFLFSDGFADQFGGEFGKKFLYKNFRDLLVKSGHLIMQNQKQYLDDAFLSWQGYNEQVDDVLVVGIEV